MADEIHNVRALVLHMIEETARHAGQVNRAICVAVEPVASYRRERGFGVTRSQPKDIEVKAIVACGRVGA